MDLPGDVFAKWEEVKTFPHLRKAFSTPALYQKWRRIFRDHSLIAGAPSRHERLSKAREYRRVWRRTNRDKVFKHNMDYFCRKAELLKSS